MMSWALSGIVIGGVLLTQLVGVFLTALQLPGTWVQLLITVAAAWWWVQWYDVSWWVAVWTPWTLGALLVLAILGEVLETLMGAAGAGKEGGSKRGMVLAIVGGIAGAMVGTVAIPIPIVGTLVGAALGSGVGSLGGDLWAGRRWHPALRAGRGAAVGRLKGAVAKLVVSASMFLVTAVAVLW